MKKHDKHEKVQLEELVNGTPISQKAFNNALCVMAISELDPSTNVKAFKEQLEISSESTPIKTANNIPENYGLNREYLSNCSDIVFLQNTYKGLKSLPLTHQLLSNLNATEIIALGYAASQIKKSESKLEKIKGYRTDYSKAISKTIGIIYSNSNIFHLLKYDEKQHSTNPGELVRRLNESINVGTLKKMADSIQSPLDNSHEMLKEKIEDVQGYRKAIYTLMEHYFHK